MKAQFVYEALDFERRLDPKEAINIGKYRKRVIKAGDKFEVNYQYDNYRKHYNIKKGLHDAIAVMSEYMNGSSRFVIVKMIGFYPDPDETWVALFNEKENEWIIE